MLRWCRSDAAVVLRPIVAGWCLEVELVEKAEVDRWLRAYVEAWKSYDGEQIGDLFSEDVRYQYHPYDEPVLGRPNSCGRGWARPRTAAPSRTGTSRVPMTPPTGPSRSTGT